MWENATSGNKGSVAQSVSTKMFQFLSHPPTTETSSRSFGRCVSSWRLDSRTAGSKLSSMTPSAPAAAASAASRALRHSTSILQLKPPTCRAFSTACSTTKGRPVFNVPHAFHKAVTTGAHVWTHTRPKSFEWRRTFAMLPEAQMWLSFSIIMDDKSYRCVSMPATSRAYFSTSLKPGVVFLVPGGCKWRAVFQWTSRFRHKGKSVDVSWLGKTNHQSFFGRNGCVEPNFALNMNKSRSVGAGRCLETGVAKVSGNILKIFWLGRKARWSILDASCGHIHLIRPWSGRTLFIPVVVRTSRS